MNTYTSSVTDILVNASIDFGVSILIILTTLVTGILLGNLIFRFGIKKIWNSEGTTNWLGSKWSTWDKLTYKPWKGYNRMRSKKWNLDHMPE